MILLDITTFQIYGITTLPNKGLIIVLITTLPNKGLR